MRKAQTDRYARWAAAAATLIVIGTLGVYARRSWRQHLDRKNNPPFVPSTVQQQSAGFSFSKVVQDRTIFTVRASQATQFKKENQSLLQDVVITLFGNDGSRNDVIQTRECNYEPSAGNMRCRGDVHIRLESAEEARMPGHPRAITVDTRDMAFNQQSGEAHTSEAVAFVLPGGSGSGRGLDYEPNDQKLRLEHNVQLKLSPGGKSNSVPVLLHGNSMDFDRNDSIIRILGSVRAQQASRTLTCELLTLQLDSDMHARELIATGEPQVQSSDLQGNLEATADKIGADMTPDGSVDKIFLEGNIHGSRQAQNVRDEFAAQRVDIALEPKQSQPNQMLATGSVQIATHSADSFEQIETASLRIDFAPDEHSTNRHIASAETLAPGTLRSKSSDEDTRIRANRFNAEFNPSGQLENLRGHSDVTIDRQLATQPHEEIDSHELFVTFARAGVWSKLALDGSVHFQQEDRVAQAERARMDRSTNEIELDGDPVVADSLARTSARTIQINQATNDIRAAGEVQTSYLSGNPTGVGSRNPAPTGQTNMGSGPAHISSDTLNGNAVSGHLVYSGHARFWQGDALLDAGTIELWRAENRMEARENVVAVLPQQPPANAPSTAPSIWKVRAPFLEFWNDSGNAHLQGGVTATSAQGSLNSQALDLFLSPAEQTTMAAKQPKSGPLDNSGRQLERAIATGSVIVRQGERRGVADQGIYTAADGKVVLSGGQPTLTDAETDTTTAGHSLTFFLANDTILVDSQKDARTLTKHRVEK